MLIWNTTLDLWCLLCFRMAGVFDIDLENEDISDTEVCIQQSLMRWLKNTQWRLHYWSLLKCVSNVSQSKFSKVDLLTTRISPVLNRYIPFNDQCLSFWDLASTCAFPTLWNGKSNSISWAGTHFKSMFIKMFSAAALLIKMIATVISLLIRSSSDPQPCVLGSKPSVWGGTVSN